MIAAWRARVQSEPNDSVLVATTVSLRARFRQRAAFYWLLLIALLAAADTTASLAFASALSFKGADYRGSVSFNLLSLAVALTCSVLFGVLKPEWWRRAITVLAILPGLALLGTSHNLVAGFAACTLVWPHIWLGRELAARFCPGLSILRAWSIGSALGLGLIGGEAFLLGTVGVLRPQAVWPLLVTIMLILGVTAHGRLADDVRACGAWIQRPVGRQPLLLLFAGIGLACLWLNLLGALAPEIRSDATRQRLVSAAHFARTGSTNPDDPDLVVATAPALGEMIYGAALTIGPEQTGKFVHFLAGLFCTAAIYALGQRLGGRSAGGFAAFVFYSTTIVGYLSQTAYLDLLTTLFAVVAALCLTLHVRPNWRTIILAGACTGLGVAIKVHFGYVAIGLAVTTAIMMSRRGHLVRVLAALLLLVVVAIAIATPWLARSYALTGVLPGLEFGTTSLTRSDNQHPEVLSDLPSFGLGRSPLSLLAVPFTATLASYVFGGSQMSAPTLGGHIGYLLLALLPLLLLFRSRRATLAIGVGAAVATVLWFYTAQYLRYGLPIIGIMCPLAGVAYAKLKTANFQRASLSILNIMVLAIALAGTSARMQMPDFAHSFAFGLQTRDAFLSDYLGLEGAGTYNAIELLNAEPAATRVFAMPDGARLYTPIKISSAETTASDLAFIGSDGDVLARLTQEGYSHILVDRRLWTSHLSTWDQVTAVDGDFLRRNAVLVGGGDYSYLYRILPPDQRGGKVSWTQGPELLPNGGFETPNGKVPAGWTAIGQPKQDLSGQYSRDGRGAVLLTGKDELVSSVAVTPSTEYLLANATKSVQDYGKENLRIEWRDQSGKVIGTSEEHMPTSPESYHAFSMLATAPANAVTATIHVQVQGGTIWFDDLSLKVFAAGAAGR